MVPGSTRPAADLLPSGHHRLLLPRATRTHQLFGPSILPWHVPPCTPCSSLEQCIIILSLTRDWKDFLHAFLPAKISPFLSLPTASLRFPKGTIMTGTEAADRLSQEVRVRG